MNEIKMITDREIKVITNKAVKEAKAKYKAAGKKNLQERVLALEKYLGLE
jgi:hypothetical protein